MAIIQSIQKYFKGLFNRRLATGIRISPVRQSTPNNWTLYASTLGRQYKEYHSKDLTEIGTWDHKTLLQVLRSVSPEASHAITMYLRVFDGTFSVRGIANNGEIDERATNALKTLITKFNQNDIARFSLPNNVRDIALKFALDCLIKGAIAGELIFDKNFRVTGIAYVDPWSIEFKIDDNGRYYPVQYQTDKLVSLDIPNFFYVPVDPLGDDPYGEEGITTAIRPIIFKTMLMQDLRMAVHVNGWQRLDFKVLEEAILKNIPPNVKNDSAQLSSFIERQLNDIIETYKALNPDDNIVHTDSVEVTPIQPARGITLDPKPLLDVIDNQIANGLKTFQILLSKKFGGGSEGFTSSEMVLYVKLVGSYQKIVESLLERALALGLRMENGIMATVDIEFRKPELRTDTELSQWQTIAIANIAQMYDEQAIGLQEKTERLREIGGFDGPVPDDISEERLNGGNNPNEPERPSSAEGEKERKRKETNRRRRSGGGK
uniref:Portal protein n=1 Tax=viral metagenome TaxID=1070528 RepID=A0A6H1ZA30_9ZZZZ